MNTEIPYVDRSTEGNTFIYKESIYLSIYIYREREREMRLLYGDIEGVSLNIQTHIQKNVFVHESAPGEKLIWSHQSLPCLKGRTVVHSFLGNRRSLMHARWVRPPRLVLSCYGKDQMSIVKTIEVVHAEG